MKEEKLMEYEAEAKITFVRLVRCTVRAKDWKQAEKYIRKTHGRKSPGATMEVEKISEKEYTPIED